MANKIKYTEPEGYFPKSILDKYYGGANGKKKTTTTAKKKTAKKSK